MDERLDNSQQLMDILLVMDKEEKTIQGGSPWRYVLQLLFQSLESD